MNKLIMAAAVATVACGCISNYKNDGGDADLKPAIVRDVAYEKYDIQEKTVSAAEQKIGILPFGFWGNLFTFGGMAQHYADNVEANKWTVETVRLAKNGAYALACEKARCDSLVGTRYDVVHKWYWLWDEATVTVTGYPAKLTGVEFRPAPVGK